VGSFARPARSTYPTCTIFHPVGSKWRWKSSLEPFEVRRAGQRNRLPSRVCSLRSKSVGTAQGFHRRAGWNGDRTSPHRLASPSTTGRRRLELPRFHDRIKLPALHCGHDSLRHCVAPMLPGVSLCGAGSALSHRQPERAKPRIFVPSGSGHDACTGVLKRVTHWRASHEREHQRWRNETQCG
jgi:hypothetical protein